MKRIIFYWPAVTYVIVLASNLCTCTAQGIIWERRVDVWRTTFAGDVVTDLMGNVYVNGYTNGLIGDAEVGGYDAYLIKYDSGGNRIWAKQFGTTSHDPSTGIAVDSAGNILTVGDTGGSLAGPDLGASDSFIRKYDSAGNVLWSRQFGSTTFDSARGVATDATGNVFVTGYVHKSTATSPAPRGDVFLRKYDGDGILTWEQTLSSPADDYGFKVAVDAIGNSYLCGYTRGNLGSPAIGGEDAFVSKLAADGTHLWTHQFGTTGQDLAYDIAVDSLGHAYVVGRINGTAFLKKYDESGNTLWMQQYTVASTAASIALDGMGGFYISGVAKNNPFVARYSSDGSQTWIVNPGILGSTYLPTVAVDSVGSIYAYNTTWFDSNLGTTLIKIAPGSVLVPEPSTIILLATSLSVALLARLRSGSQTLLEVART